MLVAPVCERLSVLVSDSVLASKKFEACKRDADNRCVHAVTLNKLLQL